MTTKLRWRYGDTTGIYEASAWPGRFIIIPNHDKSSIYFGLYALRYQGLPDRAWNTLGEFQTLKAAKAKTEK